MNLIEQVRLAGVVGAGGGGFPAHVKYAAKADTVIANGAECEPLLYKDAAVIEHSTAQLIRGVQLVMEAVGAQEGIIAIKAKKKHAIEIVEAAIKGTPLKVKLLGDYYPAGDEYDLVHEATGRLIPAGGIPIQVGVVVNNVETFANVAAAAEGRPVLFKTVTIAGAVKTPVTLSVPLGTAYRECIAAAGGATTDDPVLCLGGMMMGETTDNLDTPVTKTSTGIIVLPRSHHVVTRKLRPAENKARIGKSACDQCRYCTEYCPRFLLGYAVEPHQVMRSLAFTGTGAEYWNQWASLCCSCGLCTLFSCPEELYPKEACDASKAAMRTANIKYSGSTLVKPHPMREGRRVPIQSLLRKLHLQDYDRPAPFRADPLAPKSVTLRLKQSAGAACLAQVKAGESVSAGQVIGAPPEKALGALLHAPFAARVDSVSDTQIVLSRS